MNRHDHPERALGTRVAKDLMVFSLDQRTRNRVHEDLRAPVLAFLAPVTKIPDPVRRKEGAAPTLRAGTRPPIAEGHKGPPY